MAISRYSRKVRDLRRRTTTEPLPYICPTTQQFDGNDGSWSTFIVSIGTPGQEFRVLPSTAGSETWVPGYQGCTSNDVSDCAKLRGTDPFEGSQSAGFESNRSSTWNDIGLYSLDLESGLGYTGNGSYGYDKVSLAAPSDSGLSANNSVVAAIADKDYFLGLLGLNARATSFSSGSNNSLSFMQLAKNANEIPSLSYGYTAGAKYQGSGVLGSLTLGGYDASRFEAAGLSFPFGSQNSAPLQVGVQSITATNTLQGTASLTINNDGGNGFFANIDSTVAELVLPSGSCNAFIDNFGLTLDNSTGYYLVNDTIHSQLKSLNPSLTFKLGTTDYYNGESINIVLPYAAFDLQLSWPIYENSRNYFPVRCANSSSQVTLGRTFLQEAYIIVDYERQNFTVNQATFSSPMPSSAITTIGSTDAASSDTSSSSSSLSGGAIAGIVIGAIAGIVLLGLLAFILVRRRRQRTRKHELDDTQIHHMEGGEKKQVDGEVDGVGTLLSEAEGRQLHEMGTPVTDAKEGHTNGVPGTPGHANGGLERYEMEAPPVRYEMSAGDEHLPKAPR